MCKRIEPAMYRRLISGWIACWMGIVGFAQAPVELRVTPLLGERVGFGSTFPIAVEVLSRTKDLQGELTVSVNRGSHRRVYRYPLELPANARKQIIASPVVEAWGGEVQVSFTAPGVRMSTKVKAESYYEGQLLVALVGDAIGGLQFFKNVPVPPSEQIDEFGSRRTVSFYDAYVSPALFPSESFPLCGIRLLILGSGAERLRAEQWRAIREWVLLGGVLVVPGGSGSVVAQLPALRALLPVEVGSTREVESLHAIGRFTGTAPPKGRALIREAKPEPGTHVILAQSDLPLVVARRYGMGAVFFLAFNPLDEPMQSYNARTAFWSKLLRYAPTRTPGFLIVETHRQHAGVNPYNWGSAEPTTDWKIQLPSAPLIFTLLVVYFVLVVPVNYFVLKRFRMLDWAWLTTPMVALIFVGVIGWFTRALYQRPLSGELKSLIIVPANEREAYAISSVLFFFPRAGVYDLRFDQADMVEVGVEDLSVRTFSPTISTIEGDPRILPNYTVRNLSFQWFRYTRRVQLEGTIEAKLRVVPNNGSYQIQGTIRNRTPYTLKDLRIVAHSIERTPQAFSAGTSGGANNDLAKLEPGQTWKVNARMDLPSAKREEVLTLRLHASGDRPLILPELDANPTANASVEYAVMIPVEVAR